MAIPVGGTPRGDSACHPKEVTLSRRNRRWVGLIALVAILIVAGLVIAACGSSSSSSSSSPAAASTPKPGGTFNFPLGSDPISIEPLNTQEVDANYVAHQIFQG